MEVCMTGQQYLPPLLPLERFSTFSWRTLVALLPLEGDDVQLYYYFSYRWQNNDRGGWVRDNLEGMSVRTAQAVMNELPN